MRIPPLLPVQALAGFTNVTHQIEGGNPQIAGSALAKGQDSASIRHRRTRQKRLRESRGCKRSVGGFMQDLMWIVITILFFAVSIGYVEFCDRVK
jgi:hypothetical protein